MHKRLRESPRAPPFTHLTSFRFLAPSTASLFMSEDTHRRVTPCLPLSDMPANSTFSGL